MKKDNYKTDMVFRVDKTRALKGNVFALFPHEIADFKGNVTTYQHLGQHSVADYKYCISKSRKATKEELEPLKQELESIGYNVNVISRQNYDKYLISYNSK